MYILIKARLASMYELQNVYTLDEALKLYALYEMELDIERGKAEEMRKEAGRLRFVKFLSRSDSKWTRTARTRRKRACRT